MPSVIYVYICTLVHLYIIMVCTYGMAMGMYQCALLAAICAVCYWLIAYCLWYVSMGILYTYGCICGTFQCAFISLHPSYNIARCGICLTVLFLSDDPASFIVYACQ